jgi:hypothetical protein
MTWFTRFLLFLLSRRPDVNVAVTYLESEYADDIDAVDFLEWCYELDSAIDFDRSFYGEDPPRRGYYD